MEAIEKIMADSTCYLMTGGVCFVGEFFRFFLGGLRFRLIGLVAGFHW